MFKVWWNMSDNFSKNSPLTVMVKGFRKSESTVVEVIGSGTVEPFLARSGQRQGF